MQEKKFDLIMQLTRVEWLLHKYHQQNHMNFGPMGDPRRGQGRVLTILKMQPEISQKELSYLLDMRPQSLGELLSKLERKGFILRTPSESDRRVMNIKLTKQGEETLNMPEQEFSFDSVFDCLNEEEQKNLSEYLERMINTLESQLGDEQLEPEYDPRMRRDEHFDPHFNRGRDPFGNTNFSERPNQRGFDSQSEARHDRKDR